MISLSRQIVKALLAVAFATSVYAFVPDKCTRNQINSAIPKARTAVFPASEESSARSASASSTLKNEGSNDWYTEWAQTNGVEINSKVSIREPTDEERGKGGVEAIESIQALEVLAKIPRALVVSAVDAPARAIEAAAEAKNFSWATDLTAATLAVLHPTEEEQEKTNTKAKQSFVQKWHAGGWATDGADLGPPEANYGSKDVTGSLMATGSDNDHNIFAKFRMPCHPVVLRASNGLAVLTGCTEDEAREVLTVRGRMYRSMRDALELLVLKPSQRPTGSNREKRCWDVADVLSRVLSRATMLQLDDDDSNAYPVHAIVPLHERLAHATSGENSKLVVSGDSVLLVATQKIAVGDAITRDYSTAPRLELDESQGALHLLTQFGLPPAAWDN